MFMRCVSHGRIPCAWCDRLRRECDDAAAGATRRLSTADQETARAHPHRSGPHRFFHPGRTSPRPRRASGRYTPGPAAHSVCVRHPAAAAGRPLCPPGAACAPAGTAPQRAGDCCQWLGPAHGRCHGRDRSCRSAGGAPPHAPWAVLAPLHTVAAAAAQPLPGAGGAPARPGGLRTGAGRGGLFGHLPPTGALRQQFCARGGPGRVPRHRHRDGSLDAQGAGRRVHRAGLPARSAGAGARPDVQPLGLV